MKVESITFSQKPVFDSIGDRFYRLSAPLNVNVFTDGKQYLYSFETGFVTNCRSGGKLVDGFIEQIGDTLHQLCWLVHDANYTPCDSPMCEGAHPVPRDEADELLRAMLKVAGESRFRRNAIYYSVRLFGKKAYTEDDQYTGWNAGQFIFSSLR